VANRCCDGVVIVQSYETRPDKIARVREQSKPRKRIPLFCVRIAQDGPFYFPRVETAEKMAGPTGGAPYPAPDQDKKKPPPARGQRGRMEVAGLAMADGAGPFDEAGPLSLLGCLVFRRHRLGENDPDMVESLIDATG